MVQFSVFSQAADQKHQWAHFSEKVFHREWKKKKQCFQRKGFLPVWSLNHLELLDREQKIVQIVFNEFLNFLLAIYQFWSSIITNVSK